MIIKKESSNTTRLHHHSSTESSTSKTSSLSFKSHQEFLKDSTLSPSPRMIRRSELQKSSIRRRRASKEIVRRALNPPARRLDWRWFNFRPRPSRLSVMSMAI
ncbi:hypothetical protein LXL04_030987 [Taraxacum kok-saghyz]